MILSSLVKGSRNMGDGHHDMDGHPAEELFPFYGARNCQ